MKSLFNTVLLIGGLLMVLIWGGFLDGDELLDRIAGEPTIGETEQTFKESDFRQQFQAIVGNVEVNDTSKTAIERNIAFCDNAYIITTTEAVIKYAVDAPPSLFNLDMEKKEYYISSELQVEVNVTDKESDTGIQESNCTKARHIKPEMISKAQDLAAQNFQKAIDNSDKVLQAQAEFDRLRRQFIQQFIEAGFQEKVPEEQLKN